MDANHQWFERSTHLIAKTINFPTNRHCVKSFAGGDTSTETQKNRTQVMQCNRPKKKGDFLQRCLPKILRFFKSKQPPPLRACY